MFPWGCFQAAPAFSGRITRSKAKNQEEKTEIPTVSKHSTVCFLYELQRINLERRKQLSFRPCLRVVCLQVECCL